tara:strand:- start:399 stop:617 length:219 start_codon:yes stop_codon:yes gene_type:complete
MNSNNNKLHSKTASKIKKLASFLENNLLLEEKNNILLSISNKNIKNNNPAGVSSYSNNNDNSQTCWINSLRS